MKFGALLEQELHPPFAEGYVRYNELKLSIANDEIGFGEKLRAEVERVANYGDKIKAEISTKMDALEKQWKTVKEWKQSNFPDVDKNVDKVLADFTEVSKEIDHFLDFVTLNVTGIKKIVKKHDRRAGEVSGPLLLTKLQKDAESAYLDRLSDPKPLEILVTRCRDSIGQIQELQIKTGIEHTRRKTLAPVGGPDYFSIPRSREMSVNSTASTSTVGGPGFGNGEDLIPLTWFDTLARPLLAMQNSPDAGASDAGGILEERPMTAFAGAFLAGVGFGSFWTIIEVVLSPWAACIAVFISSCGSITGTRPALSMMYYGILACAGALAASLFVSTSEGLVANESRHFVTNIFIAWLAGACIGGWTVQIPRQLVTVSGTNAKIRMAITFAPLLGSCIGSGLLLLAHVPVGVFAHFYALGWLAFFVYITIVPLQLENQLAHPRAREISSNSEDDVELQFRTGDSPMSADAKDSWKKASSHVVTMGVLASLAIDRTVRTVVALEVVSFYPALWGEDFFLLSLGSILASFVGAVVPSWCCALIGCVSIYLMNGPGFVAWMWVEASCRHDLANFNSESAPTADTILYVADFIACIVFALELSYLENPNDTPLGLSWASGVLLLISSVGRLVSYRL